MKESYRQFADEYLVNGMNGGQAYRKIYPNTTPASARRCAYKLLNRYDVKLYIQERISEARSERVADVHEVLEYLTRVMRGQESDEVLSMSGEIKQVRCSVRDRNKAAELLGKTLGMFEKNINVNADASVSIKVDYGPDDPGQ